MTIQNTPQNVDKIQAALALALELAGQGTPVFPVRVDKKPACPHGFKDATNDSDAVKVLWELYPATLVGVPTGKWSGLDALDIDTRHGGDEWLAKNAAKIPETRVHRTRSGGWHYLFQSHDGLRNSAGRIADGVDVRADGGYIVWWPSDELAVLSDAPPACWPDWLLKLALPPPPPPHQIPTMCGTNVVNRFQDLKQAAYARAALRSAFKAVLTAGEGTRNDTLNRETWSLMRFVGAGVLSVQDIANALVSAALAAGLDRSEVTSTVASAIRSRGTV